MNVDTTVYFGVFDFGGDLSAVTSILGVEPTTAWVKGEHYSSEYPTAIRTHDRWSLSSGLPESAPIEDHLSALLRLLEPISERIVKVTEMYDAKIGVAQYIKEINPEFWLSADIMQRVGALGLSISFDQYFLNEDEDS